MMKLIITSRIKGISLLVIFLLSLDTITVTAQVDPVAIQQELEKEIYDNRLGLNSPAEVRAFYKAHHYKMAWITPGPSRAKLLEFVEGAYELGLDKTDYRYDLMQSLCNGTKHLSTTGDSLQAEFLLTDAAIHFFNEAAYGSHPPELRFNGLDYSPSCLNIPNLLAAALSLNKFNGFLQFVECKSPEYPILKNYLAVFDRMSRDPNAAGGNIVSNKVEAGNKPLIQKLFFLQLVDTVEKQITEKELQSKLLAAQKLFSQPEDGKLTAALIRDLNLPAEYRIEALRRTINTIRWLRCIRERSQHVIVVNIPSASLLLFKGNSIVLQSKVIVGKPATPSPVFAAKVEEVVMYPYWMVPKSIATKELLPHIKRNANYLKQNGFQVVNLQGKIVNPASINWQALSTGYFPYILRQSTGCDNSLGIVKLNFYSPFGVYLHDTPTKSLFNANKRFFSHGCIRVEKAMQVARLLLGNNTIAVDTIEEKGCLRNQKPIPVELAEKIPLFVLYNTAWVDSSGALKFSGDVYNKFSQSKR
jgi:L,D-transpeptidase YcbB